MPQIGRRSACPTISRAKAGPSIDWSAVNEHLTLRDAHLFPNTALFFPVVKRFAVDLVDGSLRNGHAARLSGHEEIDVVNRAARTFHIDAGKIFAAAKAGKPIIVDPDQIEREIFALVVDVEFFVGGSSPLVIDVPFDAGRDIGIAYFSREDVDLRGTRCCCRRGLYCWLPQRQRMFPGSEKRHSKS